MAESTTEFHIRIADASLNFQTLSVSDPVPAGRQLLADGGFRPPEAHLLFELLENGALEERRLDEVTDLRPPGPRTFLAFRSDRSFRFVLDDRRFEWGASKISEAALRWLASADAKDGGVWIELRDEPDRLLDRDEVTALNGNGTERFRTERLYPVCIEGKEYRWPHPTITPEKIAELGGWDPAEGVVEVDPDQNERTLKPNEEVKLGRGHTFGKKLRFKRGNR